MPVVVPNTTRASALYEASEINGVAADSRFKGREITIWGVISSVDADIWGTPYITLDDHSVQCLFPKEDAAMLATFRRGQSVTITGTVSSQFLMSVIVRNCRLTTETDTNTAGIY
jgi:tRNA_anti-like